MLRGTDFSLSYFASRRCCLASLCDFKIEINSGPFSAHTSLIAGANLSVYERERLKDPDFVVRSANGSRYFFL